MTVLEATVSILEKLPEEKLRLVNDYAQELLTESHENPYGIESANAAEEEEAMNWLLGELERGVQSGNEAGWISEAEMEARFQARRAAFFAAREA